jgi:citrate lyase subunit beta / citryl-CoA lyase
VACYCPVIPSSTSRSDKIIEPSEVIHSMHPREVLLDAQAAAFMLPAVDHYCGVEARIRKALALQTELINEFGACVMDVTLDCEDGAPAGQERDHAELVVQLLTETDKADQAQPLKAKRRLAVRVHPVDHPAFESDVSIIVKEAHARLSHVMIPKAECLSDVMRAVKTINAVGGEHLPVHVLIESSRAVENAIEIASHPRVQSLSFGLMDFVSSHGGAIPATAMTAQGQFEHPLVIRAKLEIAAACHAYGKVPSHCVVTEFSDAAAIENAAKKASQELGYTRMWSIHPAQIRPILAAFAPQDAEIARASEIIALGASVAWAPASHHKQLHDRASYRYYWQVIERAHSTGKALSAEMRAYF